MIPVSDSVRSRRVPYVNVAIIIINFAVFLYEVYLSHDVIRGNVTELDNLIQQWGNIPACTFRDLGADVSLNGQGRAICAQQDQPLLTVFTAMFMHGGWLHIGGNMLFLWIFGDNVEDAMGHARYAIFYLLCGIVASLAQGLMDVNGLTPSIGASGAIAGIMGAYIVLYPRAVVSVIALIIPIPIPAPAFLVIGLWLLIQVFNGWASLGVHTASGGVAYFAHIGGFIAGAALVSLFALGRPRPRVPKRPQQYW